MSMPLAFSDNPARIIGIQFGILSPEEIRNSSVVHVITRDRYVNNKPVVGGLFDPRMGVLEPDRLCVTDGLSSVASPGYPGHIELAKPMFFMQHIKEIVRMLKCVCFKCAKLLIDKTEHSYLQQMPPEKRWANVELSTTKIKRCGSKTTDGCGCKRPTKIRKEGMCTILACWNALDKTSKQLTTTVQMTPEMILKIFRRIPNDDVLFMGFHPTWSRPEWMICTVLPVPPPAVRPSVFYDMQQRSEDDLTQIYSNIIRLNNDLRRALQSDNATQAQIENPSNNLQYLIAMVFNNKIKGADPLAQRSGRKMQCITTRLNTKHGRFRGNLMGKRVEYSARTVITADPNLSIKQLGVPLKIAMNITKRVVVNDRNRAFLLVLVRNGPDIWPGAKIIDQHITGVSIYLKFVNRTLITLENGDVVHRHMMDGDAVIFNRQPSLHRMSMMCHIVKVMHKGSTFRFSVSDTKPYNADFDGDEMNMHMPQSLSAEIEILHLAAIPHQIISPSTHSPIIGIFQDSLLGAFQFTSAADPKQQQLFSIREAMTLLSHYRNVDTRVFAAAFAAGNCNCNSLVSACVSCLCFCFNHIYLLQKNKKELEHRGSQQLKF